MSVDLLWRDFAFGHVERIVRDHIVGDAVAAAGQSLIVPVAIKADILRDILIQIVIPAVFIPDIASAGAEIAVAALELYIDDLVAQGVVILGILAASVIIAELFVIAGIDLVIRAVEIRGKSVRFVELSLAFVVSDFGRIPSAGSTHPKSRDACGSGLVGSHGAFTSRLRRIHASFGVIRFLGPSSEQARQRFEIRNTYLVHLADGLIVIAAVLHIRFHPARILNDVEMFAFRDGQNAGRAGDLNVDLAGGRGDLSLLDDVFLIFTHGLISGPSVHIARYGLKRISVVDFDPTGCDIFSEAGSGLIRVEPGICGEDAFFVFGVKSIPDNSFFRQRYAASGERDDAYHHDRENERQHKLSVHKSTSFFFYVLIRAHIDFTIFAPACKA